LAIGNPQEKLKFGIWNLEFLISPFVQNLDSEKKRLIKRVIRKQFHHREDIHPDK
jgi:hypothetical protein